MSDSLIDDNIFEKENEEVDYVGFMPRFWASFIDGILFAPLIWYEGYNNGYFNSFLLSFFVLILINIYKPFMEYYYGATLGKMVFKIEVVDYNFEPITFSQALIRYIPWIVDLFLGVFAIIVYYLEVSVLYDIYDKIIINNHYTYLDIASLVFLIIIAIPILNNFKGQGLHDKWARTYCIYKNKKN